ncbi:HNH endonuclease signature motif containing protein [Salmonella bongori]|uniref:HNH endonuclease signature motif containing protein n=1 Tax=Salmonella bongori TaxID=54736 RepID=UPI0002E1DD2D|nr:HNH endonuclease signature motif containing protein [Salmonella bongori]VDZ80852.1 uropathogenic specific protein [Salmonella bongori]
MTNNGNGAPIPAHIADKLCGREFKNFDNFREALWLEVSKDPVLMEQFSEFNQIRISHGFTPFVPDKGHYVGPKEIVKKFQIHHFISIEYGGGVYNIDNLRIVTPKLHDEIHYRR